MFIMGGLIVQGTDVVFVATQNTDQMFQPLMFEVKFLPSLIFIGFNSSWHDILWHDEAIEIIFLTRLRNGEKVSGKWKPLKIPPLREIPFPIANLESRRLNKKDAFSATRTLLLTTSYL